jgi:outer membrane biogenesis lipoprotein LolB
MKRNVVLLAVACVLVLSGCTSTAVRNAANTECERRVHSDRERCLRNNRSSDEALAARNGSERESKDSWVAQTLERIEAEVGK